MAVFIITLLVFLMLIAILLWVKTPRYMMRPADVITLFHNVLTGQATENDWTIFLSSSFRHCPPLEPIRAACAELDEKEYLGDASSTGFLLSRAGLAQLRILLERVERIAAESN